MVERRSPALRRDPRGGHRFARSLVRAPRAPAGQPCGGRNAGPLARPGRGASFCRRIRRQPGRCYKAQWMARVSDGVPPGHPAQRRRRYHRHGRTRREFGAAGSKGVVLRRPVVPSLRDRRRRSDDFPATVKADAARDLTEALLDKSLRCDIAARFPLEEVANAHELVEAGPPGRVLVEIS